MPAGEHMFQRVKHKDESAARTRDRNGARVGVGDIALRTRAPPAVGPWLG